jgi:hypothetical protein
LVRCAARLPCHSQPPSAIHPKVTDDCADQFNSPYSFCFQTRMTILEDDGGFVDGFGSKRNLFALAHTRSALARANQAPDLLRHVFGLPDGLQLIISAMSTLSLLCTFNFLVKLQIHSEKMYKAQGTSLPASSMTEHLKQHIFVACTFSFFQGPYPRCLLMS